MSTYQRMNLVVAFDINKQEESKVVKLVREIYPEFRLKDSVYSNNELALEFEADENYSYDAVYKFTKQDTIEDLKVKLGVEYVMTRSLCLDNFGWDTVSDTGLDEKFIDLTNNFI